MEVRAFRRGAGEEQAMTVIGIIGNGLDCWFDDAPKPKPTEWVG
jgi:hypothetical protein